MLDESGFGTLDGETKLRNLEGEDARASGGDERQLAATFLARGVVEVNEERVGHVGVTDGTRVADEGSDTLGLAEEVQDLIDLRDVKV